CPINDRFGASLDSGLIEPGVTRFGERLNKIERAAIAFFPVVIGQVTNLNGRNAFKSIVRSHSAALERGDAYRDFKRRSRRIRGTKCTREMGNIWIVLQSFKFFRRDGWN